MREGTDTNLYDFLKYEIIGVASRINGNWIAKIRKNIVIKN
jgi:hypothetical protein